MGILIDSHPKLSRLGWKTPVIELIGDDFVMQRIEDTNVITVDHLLSHTSGFSGQESSGPCECSASGRIIVKRSVPEEAQDVNR